MKSSSFNSKNNYRPKRVLTGYASSAEGISSWLYHDLDNDPWWQGANAVPYRFLITFTITPVVHGSHITREPFSYNGLDIVPGMWVSSFSESKALKITKIITKSAFTITAECEDEYRYNTFKDNSGNGNASFLIPAPVIFFELGDDGLPVFDPLPPEATDLSIIGQIESRFRFFNSTKKIKLFKQNHDFYEADMISIRNGEYEKVLGEEYIIGIVSDIGPSPNDFWIIPNDTITRIEPGFSGSIGTLGWYDGDKITTTPQNYSPHIMKIKQEIPAHSTYKTNNIIGDFSLNGFQLTSAGDFASIINSTSIKHGCIVERSPVPLIVSSSEIAPYTAVNLLEFKINNTLISCRTPSIQFGDIDMLGAWDVVREINETSHLHGVFANVDNNGSFLLTLHKNTLFENITPKITSDNAKTFTDMFSLQEYYYISEQEWKIIRPDGGDIIITSEQVELEAKSSSNGELAITANLPVSSVKTSTNYIVPTIADRNAIVGIRNGDQVYVINTGYGEWGLFIKTNSGFVKVSDENSANTDANTFNITFNAGDPAKLIGNMSKGSRVSNITCIVYEPFDSTFIFGLGFSDMDTSISGGEFFDFRKVGSYTYDSTYIIQQEDQSLWLWGSGSSVGSCRFVISYL